MKVINEFPVYASGGSCFITGRAGLDLEAGDRVVLCDVQNEDRPEGMVCIHSSTVKMMVGALGWELLTDELREEHKQVYTDYADALDRIDKLEQALGLLGEASPRMAAVAAELDQEVSP